MDGDGQDVVQGTVADVVPLPGRDREWVPQFDGQREPFATGNQMAATHGAYSERRLLEVAAEFEAGLMADPQTPAYVRGGQFSREVTAWARAEARVELITQILDEMGLRAAMDERTRGTEDEVNTQPGGTRRKIRQKRTPPPLDALERAEGAAARRRAALGLSPASYAVLVKDVNLARRAGEYDPLVRMAEQGRAMMVAREAGGQEAVHAVTARFDAEDAEREAERRENAERVAAVARGDSGQPA